MTNKNLTKVAGAAILGWALYAAGAFNAVLAYFSPTMVPNCANSAYGYQAWYGYGYDVTNCVVTGWGGWGWGWINGSSSLSSSTSSTSSSVDATAPKPGTVGEMEGAYQWAKSKGITSQPTYDTFEPYSPLLRKHMAKFLSQFAVNVLGKTPDTSRTDCKFYDLGLETQEMKDYAVMACQLGMMGYKPDSVTVHQSQFWPNEVVTRAQFGTALSRLLWGDTYAVSNAQANQYWVRHLQALKDAGIMTQIETPNQVELRGWVVLMMWRQASNMIAAQ